MALFYPFKLYSVHLNPAAERPYETAVFVPEGFNFWAFIFSAFWALYHRLWILGFVLFCLYMLIVALGEHYGFSPASILVLNFGIKLLVGFQGNDALRIAYDKRGYIVADMVAAHTLLEAEQRFYDRYLPQVTAEAGATVTLADA